MKERLKKINKVLVSQPEPSDKKSPYFQLGERYGVDIDFRQFIKVEEVSFKEFRKEKIEILDHTAIILTSRNAVDHFFNICTEGKIEVPADMKYFCINEQTSNYLQKYIVIRKRKIFTGQRTELDLLDVLKKHPKEKYLFPCSEQRKDLIPNFLKENEYTFNEAVIYRTVSADLSDLAEINYDVIAFFSPSGITSLLKNFPTFQQNGTRIAAFGPTTQKAVLDAGLILDIEVPLPEAPSMTGALDLYIKKVNK